MVSKSIKVVLLVLIIGGLVASTTYLYINRYKPTPVATVSQKQYDDLKSTLAAHDAVASVKTQQLATQIQSGDAKLASTCAQLKTLKAVNVNCN